MVKKKKTVKRPQRSSQSGKQELTKLRRQIDRLDRTLVKTINERAKLAEQIGQLKARFNQPAYAPEREHEILRQVSAASKGPLPETAVRAVFRELISGSRALENFLKVGFLGPEYSYSYLAAIERFGQSAQFVSATTIAGVFADLQDRQTQYGLVPLENSTHGRISDTLDMFVKMPVRICGEVPLRIHHNLLSCGSQSKIQKVFSKPQALSQCRQWLNAHLPRAQTVEVTSTSEAARLAKENSATAAIASLQAGINNGLNLLARHIEDNPDNLTRFAVISESSAQKTGNDKTSVMFEIADRPGALADATAIFKRNRLNMTWIESFPVAGFTGRYLFFVEFSGHETDLRVRRAVESLQKKALHLKVLGSYAQVNPIG